MRLMLGCRRRTRSSWERRSLSIWPIQRLREARKRSRELLGVRAGHILQLAGQNVADGRLTQMAKYRNMATWYRGKQSVEAVDRRRSGRMDAASARSASSVTSADQISRALAPCDSKSPI
jgi:hypothetical protein